MGVLFCCNLPWHHRDITIGLIWDHEVGTKLNLIVKGPYLSENGAK